MNGHKADVGEVGMRLVVAAKTTLTIGEKDLVIAGMSRL